jgi:hypothetical protein
MNELNQRSDIRQNESRVKINSVTSYYKQRGITGIGIAIVIALVAFFALIAIRLFPIYMEHFSVASHLKDVANDPETKSYTDAQILDTLQKRFDIDDVTDVHPDDITIDHTSSPMTISIDYEVRTHAMGNVDMVVSFSNKVDVR